MMHINFQQKLKILRTEFMLDMFDNKYHKMFSEDLNNFTLHDFL